MPALLVLALVIVPLAELAIIIQLGGWIGAGWTIVALLANSLLGAWLLRREGRRAWAQFRAALGAGRWPGDEVAQGGLVILGGALLLTPGFLTDLVGFVCLLPPTRALAAAAIRARVTAGVVGAPFGATRRAAGDRGAARPHGRTDDRVVGEVEVLEVRREEPRTDGPRPGSSDADPSDTDER